VLFVLGGLVLHHQLADWEHVVAFPTGYGLARLMQPRRMVELSASTVTSAARRRVVWFARPAGVLAAIGVGAVAIGFAPPVAAVPARASGGLRVLDTVYPSPSLGGTRSVLVVLPDGASGRRFPVLEILHGRPGQPNDALTGLDLLRSAAAAAAILVMPDGHGPVVREGDFADTSRQRLGAALSDDLRRWVDATFPTDGRWAVAGYSAGGYGAAYLASRDVGSYQLVCPISGYFTARDPAFAGESPAVRDAASPVLHAHAAGPRVVLIVGTSDPEAQRETMAYADALARAHQPYEFLQLSGGHSASVWRPGVERCLQGLAGLPSPSGSR
jgi:enterochelin esterase-like enzyme